MDKGKDKITAKQERERQLSAEEERARAAEAAAAETGRMRQEAAREGIGNSLEWFFRVRGGAADRSR